MACRPNALTSSDVATGYRQALSLHTGFDIWSGCRYDYLWGGTDLQMIFRLKAGACVQQKPLCVFGDRRQRWHRIVKKRIQHHVSLVLVPISPVMKTSSEDFNDRTMSYVRYQQILLLRSTKSISPCLRSTTSKTSSKLAD
jgi:hypothetical protein